MKKLIFGLMALLLLCAFTVFEAAALNFSSTAGDQDFGALRDDFDNQTNMDWFVFAAGVNITRDATNSLGYIERLSENFDLTDLTIC